MIRWSTCCRSRADAEAHTKNSPSYWHGWSPDGKTLAFVGQRDGEFDIYSIPVTGGDETRLTTQKVWMMAGVFSGWKLHLL